jgi:hypothetical protein
MKRAAAVLRRRALRLGGMFGLSHAPIRDELDGAVAEIEQDADIMQREGR